MEHIVIRCLSCGTKNRIPQGRLQQRPLCGKCRKPLDDIIIHCLACGKKNRIPEEKIERKALCGHCGFLLVAHAHQEQITVLSDDSFYREVVAAAGETIIVECFAPWCAPCRTLEPILEELAAQYSGGAKFAKLNIDENPLTASKYSIRSVPAILFFKNGDLIDRMVGLRPKKDIEQLLLTILRRN